MKYNYLSLLCRKVNRKFKKNKDVLIELSPTLKITPNVKYRETPSIPNGCGPRYEIIREKLSNTELRSTLDYTKIPEEKIADSTKELSGFFYQEDSGFWQYSYFADLKFFRDHDVDTEHFFKLF